MSSGREERARVDSVAEYPVKNEKNTPSEAACADRRAHREHGGISGPANGTGAERPNGVFYQSWVERAVSDRIHGRSQPAAEDRADGDCDRHRPEGDLTRWCAEVHERQPRAAETVPTENSGQDGVGEKR